MQILELMILNGRQLFQIEQHSVGHVQNDSSIHIKTDVLIFLTQLSYQHNHYYYPTITIIVLSSFWSTSEFAKIVFISLKYHLTQVFLLSLYCFLIFHTDSLRCRQLRDLLKITWTTRCRALIGLWSSDSKSQRLLEPRAEDAHTPIPNPSLHSHT